MRYFAIIVLAFLLSACTGMQIRDGAKEKFAILDAAYMVAVTDVLSARTEWRRQCNVLRDKYYEVNSQTLTSTSEVEAAIQNHNKMLPQIETISAFTDDDGSIVSRVNKVQCNIQ